MPALRASGWCAAWCCAAWVLASAGCAKRPPSLPSGMISRPLEMRLPLFPSGEMHDLREDRGKVVLLDIWATWCEPCREALPFFQALHQKYGPSGLRVYALNVDEDRRQVAPFLEKNHIQLPVLLDAEAQFSERELNIQMIPTSFILDRRGVIRRVHEGFFEPPPGPYPSDIEALLSEPLAGPTSP